MGILHGHNTSWGNGHNTPWDNGHNTPWFNGMPLGRDHCLERRDFFKRIF